jgi:hypothetical protein
MRLKPILLLIVLSLGSSPAYAKRAAPRDVPPVTLNGIEYSAPHWGLAGGKQQNGGYIEAKDVKTGKLLWELRIYEIKYNPNLETDVQDLFITSMKLVDGRLQVSNEVGDKVVVDLLQRKVIERNHVYLAGKINEGESPLTSVSLMIGFVVATGLLAVLWRFRRPIREEQG